MTEGSDSRELAVIPERTQQKRGFFKGMKKPEGSGRKKGSPSRFVWLTREIAESKGVNPYAVLLDAAVRGQLPPIGGPGARDEQGKPLPNRAISIEEQNKCLRDCLRYLIPSIASLQVTGADGGPLRLEQVNVVELMADPQLAAAAQAISLAVTGSKRKDLANESEDIIDAEECSEDEPQTGTTEPGKPDQG